MQQNPFEQFNIGADSNPLLSSMEILRKAWGSMPNNPMASMSPLQMQSPEELEKRITELQAVENWLALNLSMLRNTIQALEIQRSTLSAFQAFSQMQWPGMGDSARTDAAASDSQSHSPKESAQSQAEAQQAAAAQASQAKAGEVDEADEADGEGADGADEAATTKDESSQQGPGLVDEKAMMQAGQAWWDLMQQQFQALVETSQSSVQAAQSAAEQFRSSSGVGSSPAASADTTFGSNPTTDKDTTGKQTTGKAQSTAAKTQSSQAAAARKTAKQASKKATKKATKKAATKAGQKGAKKAAKQTVKQAAKKGSSTGKSDS